MKKFLALVLALVMSMSLVTMAGAEDFTDAADINYEEAVEVMTAVGVVGGYADGSFNPEGGLTRQAAAKIICNMILGPTTAAELDADTNPYPDVDKDSAFAGYIAYCQKEGIISGYADGTFKGANPLTGYAFMKMLLGALGYEAETEGYTGANWSINVAKKAIGEGLNAGLKEEFNGSDYVTREEACLYAFNTLKATMVEYDQQTTINVGGAEVVLAGSAQDLAWGTGTLNDGKVEKDGFVQFAEKYFSKLTRTDDTDVFGRPANTWTYNKVEVGTFVDYTTLALTYTTGVEGGVAYKDLGSAAADFAFTAWLDGVMSKTIDTNDDMNVVKGEDKNMANTGNGVLTEVYVDVDEEEVTVVQINTYLAEVTADYNKNKETVTVSVYTDNQKVNVSKIFLEDVASIVDLKEGDMILVNIADDVIVEVAEPEVLSGAVISKYSTDGMPSYITVDGEKIDAAYIFDAAACDNKLKAYDQDALEDFTYDVYMDQYGYVNAIFECEGTAKYLFLVGYDKVESNLAIKTADSLAIFTDGTMAKIEVNFNKTNENIAAAKGNELVIAGDANRNEWFKYSEDDGVYTLTPVDNQVVVYYGEKSPAKTEINVESVRVSDGAGKVAYGNDDSTYITVDYDAVDKDGDTRVIDSKNGIDEVVNVYTGVQDVDLVLFNNVFVRKAAAQPTDEEGTVEAAGDVIYALYDAADLYITAAIVIGDEADNTNKDFAYALKGAKSEEFKDGAYFWDFDAVVEGVVKTLTVKDNYEQVVIKTIQSVICGGSKWAIPALLELEYDEDGYVVGAVVRKDADKDIYGNEEFVKTADIDPEVFAAYLTEYVAQNVVELTHRGRTLYTNEAQDVGLTLVAGAPVVVLQPDEDGKLSIEEYASIDAAIDALEDADATDNGVDFVGVVSAALNDKGTAEWIVLSSATKLVDDVKEDKNDAGVSVKVSLLAGTVTVTGAADADAAAEAALNALLGMGYEFVSYASSVLTVTNANGGSVPFTVVVA